MKRKIIRIDEEKCNGCGACASACHEGAIEMTDGKARLVREDYCDGLGDCLPECPTNAITFEIREAAAYDKRAVLLAKALKKENNGENYFSEKNTGRYTSEADLKKSCADGGNTASAFTCGCPGSRIQRFERDHSPQNDGATDSSLSQLAQWPCQIKLVPVNAPYFRGARLLVAADCAAYACSNIHAEFMKNRITLIGCPKLDAVDYSEKLAEIIKTNDIKSITVLKMEVPCCSGLEAAVKNAIMRSGKLIPWSSVTISTSGKVIDT